MTIKFIYKHLLSYPLKSNVYFFVLISTQNDFNLNQNKMTSSIPSDYSFMFVSQQ